MMTEVIIHVEESILSMSKSTKTKNKSLIKLFAILSSVGVLLSAVGGIVVGSFAKTKAINVSEYQDAKEFYGTKGFDLIVKGPSLTQIEGFKIRDDVARCVSYLEIDLNTTINGKLGQSTFLVFDDVADLKYTENTDVRLIENFDIFNDFVFVDYKFAEINNLKLGDSLTVTIDGSPKKCTISRIYKTDYIFSRGVLITSTNVVPSSFKTAIYLKSNNVASLKEDLSDYKPLGTLLEKTEYQTDEQYQKYLDDFYSRDYSSTHVLDYKEKDEMNESTALPKANSASTALIVATIVFGVLSFLISLAGFIVVAKNKNDFIYKYIHDNGSKGIIKAYSIFNALLIVTCAVTALISTFIAANATSVYCSVGSVFVMNILSFIIPIIGVAVGYLITTLLVRKA